jgi:hypothetical protein
MLSSKNDHSDRNRAAALAVGLSLMAILLIGVAPGRAATTGTSYDNVQVLIQTSNSTFTGSYSVTAYNSTGYPLVTYQTPYPAASFELPSGSYIFTATATAQYTYGCAVPGGVTPVEAGGPSASSSGSSGGPAIIVDPCMPAYTGSEYGYAVQQVSGPTTVTVSAKPMTTFPTTAIKVHVSYANGTAASGAILYASVLGGQGYGVESSGSASNVPGQIGNNGTATLIVPVAPVEVTAWSWVPVNVPVNGSTMQVTIGGQAVNVSVNWQPAYVGLAGSLLIIPPQTGGNITLQLQQPTYWVTPYGVQTPTAGASTGLAAVANSPDSVPASVSSAEGTASASVSAETVVQTTTLVEHPDAAQVAPASGAGGYEIVLLTVVGALALGIASASLIVVRRRQDV